MAFDDLDAEISYLMNAMEEQPEDLHEVEFRLRQLISGLRAEGLPVPDSLKDLEAELDRLLSKLR